MKNSQTSSVRKLSKEESAMLRATKAVTEYNQRRQKEIQQHQVTSTLGEGVEVEIQESKDNISESLNQQGIDPVPAAVDSTQMEERLRVALPSMELLLSILEGSLSKLSSMSRDMEKQLQKIRAEQSKITEWTSVLTATKKLSGGEENQ